LYLNGFASGQIDQIIVVVFVGVIKYCVAQEEAMTCGLRLLLLLLYQDQV
jgi:hypothetical protein